MRLSRYWWPLLFLLALALWSVHLGRPLDLPGWHEIDYSAVARNFLREGNNLFYPRIDWRGDGPGFTEMEFPIIPWVMAQLYRLFGVHETFGRIFSLLCMLAALWVFRKLALKLLPEPAALIAALFFVVGHEVTVVATAIQPESLMLLCYLLAVYYFTRWYESNRWRDFTLAVVSFALAVLVKSPAAHLAIFFFIWALMHDGWRAFRKLSLYLFALLGFAPALLWYLHAAGLWHQFHNSMGVSNEDHWIGIDLLARPKVFANMLTMQVVFVFGLGGLFVVLAGLVKSRLASPVSRLALSWCLAVAIYLIVILRTSGGYWAAYYHVVAVPPVALLFGAGVDQVQRYGTIAWRQIVLWICVPAVLLSAGSVWVGGRNMAHMSGVMHDLAVGHSSWLTVSILTAISLAVTLLCFGFGRPASGIHARTPIAVVVGCFTYFFVSAQLLIGTWNVYSEKTTQFQDAASFKRFVPDGSLIVASGGICLDPGGHKTANDAPDMFYWLDSKGFSTCQGQQSVAVVEEYAKRGAQYFVADKATLAEQPGLEADLRRKFPLLADSQADLLFKLPLSDLNTDAKTKDRKEHEAGK